MMKGHLKIKKRLNFADLLLLRMKKVEEIAIKNEKSSSTRATQCTFCHLN